MRYAVVTGAGSGIGRAVAISLADAGFEVALVGRRPAALEGTATAVAQRGGRAVARPADVSDAEQVGRLFSRLRERWQRLDVLVHAAGAFRLAPLEETTDEVWREAMGASLTGAFLCARAAWPILGGGQIINISSVAGIEPYEGCAAYGAAKHGLVGLSRVLDVEGRARGIRVHVVCPGNTDTPLWAGQAPEGVRERMMPAERVAETVRWLATSPADVRFDPVVIRPAVDPWLEDGASSADEGGAA